MYRREMQAEPAPEATPTTETSPADDETKTDLESVAVTVVDTGEEKKDTNPFKPEPSDTGAPSESEPKENPFKGNAHLAQQ